MSSELPDFAIVSHTAKSVDLECLRGEISSALGRFPIDEPALREAVLTYADAERRLGTSVGHVVVVINELAETANIAPFSIRQARTKQLVLWAVDRYFDHRDPPSAGSGTSNRTSRPDASRPISPRTATG